MISSIDLQIHICITTPPSAETEGIIYRPLQEKTEPDLVSSPLSPLRYCLQLPTERAASKDKMTWIKTISKLAVAALLAPVQGVVIRAHIAENCEGYYQDINIYDNTCWTGPQTWGVDFLSYYITTYGAGGQYVRSYPTGGGAVCECPSDGCTCQGAAAPGAAPLGTCYTIPKANAFGSSAISCGN